MAPKKKHARRTVRKHVARTTAPVAVAAPPAPPPVVHAAPAPPDKQMKSIWYMVGLVLAAMGALIFATGIYLAVEPPGARIAMSHLQPDLWWGAVMFVVGGVFIFTHRNKTHAV